MKAEYNTTDIILNQACVQRPSATQPIPVQGFMETQVLQCLGYDAQALPLGDLLKKRYDLPKRVLVVSPVHFATTHNNALITAYGEDAFTNADAMQTCFDALATFFKQTNIHLQSHKPGLWFISIPDGLPALHSPPVFEMDKQHMAHALTAMDKHLYWQRLLTEIQMYLHHTFFTREESIGCNGVWIWGDGVLGAKTRRKMIVDTVYAPLAACLSTEPVCYTAETVCTGHPLILLTDDKLTPTQYSQIKKTNSRWYWNDQAYCDSAASIWTRFWRGLFHAY